MHPCAVIWQCYAGSDLMCGRVCCVILLCFWMSQRSLPLQHQKNMWQIVHLETTDLRHGLYVPVTLHWHIWIRVKANDVCMQKVC